MEQSQNLLEVTDPEDRRHYHPWSLRFAVADSYPTSDLAEDMPAWQALQARFSEQADADPAFAEEWDSDDLADVYNDRRMERMAAQRARLFGAPRQTEVPPGLATMPDPDAMDPLPQAFAWEIIAAQIADLRRAWESLDRRIAYARRGLKRPGWIGRLFSPKTSPFIVRLTAHKGVIGQALKAAEAERAALQEIAPWEILDGLAMKRFTEWLKAGVVSHAATRDQREFGTPDPAQAYEVGLRYFARLCGGHPYLCRSLPGGLDTVAAFYPEQALHQMLGWFESSQENASLTDGSVPLLHLSYDTAPGFRICDVGEFQVFIDPTDLQRRDFSRAHAQMQGG